MDLSQQELPLTAYFTRGSGAKSDAVPCKKEKPTQDSQSVARSSKRSRNNVQCTTASPLTKSDPRLATLQLPTPATSARKRMRYGRLEDLPSKTRPPSTGVLLSSVEQNPVLSSENDLAQLEFEPTPSKSTLSSRRDAEDAVSDSPLLATPSTNRRKIAKPVDIESPLGPRLFSHSETGIEIPQTSSRRAEPMHGIDDHSPLARSNFHLPSKSSQVPPRLPGQGVSHAVQLLTCSTTGFPCPPVDSGCSDPFYEKNNILVLRDGASALPKQYFIQSETLDSQPSDGHAIPVIPVPSSQSQYLLHLDATPKRKRCSRHIEHVISSQTQEERELTLSMSHKPAATVTVSVGVSPGK